MTEVPRYLLIDATEVETSLITFSYLDKDIIPEKQEWFRDRPCVRLIN